MLKRFSLTKESNMSRLGDLLQKTKTEAKELESRKTTEAIEPKVEDKVRKAVNLFMKDVMAKQVLRDGFMDWWPTIGAKKVGVSIKDDMSSEDTEQFLDIVLEEITKSL